MLKLISSRATTAYRAFTGLAATALLVAACGGGGQDSGAGVSTGAGAVGTPQSFTSGRISGLGSIIVNGVRFDDSKAVIRDDDDAVKTTAELGLGMVVAIKSDKIVKTAARSTGTAGEIVLLSELKGPVTAINASAGTLSVLGLNVTVSANTVFDGAPNGLASLRAGNLVEIYAALDPVSGTYAASRIELKSTLAAYKLRGIVSALDTTVKTFKIGTALISYGLVRSDELPVLSNGLLVVARLSITEQAGMWIATKLNGGARRVHDNDETELEGYVSDFVSAANFKLNGIRIDASGTAVKFENGSLANIVNGVRLEVEGDMRSGVLVAREVEIKKTEKDEKLEFELHGTILQIDPVKKTFVMRGVTVSYSDLTVFKDGTLAKLAIGARVEVKGQLAANGMSVTAVRISFES